MIKQTTYIRVVKGAAALLAVLVLSGNAAGADRQRHFPTPEVAVEALVDGVARQDEDGVRATLGIESGKLLPLDNVSAEDRLAFLSAWAQGRRILLDGDRVARLELSNGWTLPIPLVRTADGWVFDTEAGKAELRTRRIGRNELAAIEILRAFVDAQREYAEQDRAGDGVREFAQRLVSSPGRRDGLYWPTAEGEAESPAGSLLDTRDLKDGYHGYRFRILKAQGPAAPGGARPYVRNGRMTEGFAAVGWPARPGESGLMTFIVGQDGVVYQKYLGPNTAAIAKAMTRFDPDSSWAPLPAP